MSKNPGQEILIINKRGEIIFEYGSGKLTKAKDIVATITQALQLYSKQILKEEIQFIRFQNQRMFFQSSVNKDFIAVQLVNKSLLTKQFLPGLKILLGLVDKVVNALGSNQKALMSNQRVFNQLKIFFRIISDPTKTLIVVPKDHLGFLSLIVLFSGFFFDLSKKIDSMLSNIVLLSSEEILTTIKNNCESILAIGVPENRIKLPSNIVESSTMIIGKNAPIQLTNLSNTLLTREVSLFFGEGSNAERIYNLTISSDVEDIAQQLTQLPKEADDILLEAIKESIEHSGKNLTKVLYRNLIKKIKEKETEKLTSRAALGYISESIPEINQQIQPPHTQPEVSIPTESSYNPPLTPTPEIIQEPITESIPSQEQFRTVPEVVDASALPADLDQNTGKIVLETAPILIDSSPYMTGQMSKYPQYVISMQICPLKDNRINFFIQVGSSRTQEYMKSLSDVESRISGELSTESGGILLSIPKDHFYTAYKGLMWTLFIEYAYQVQKNLLPTAPIFEVPNEGSVCIIPDGVTLNRRKQLPKQIVDIFEENLIIEEVETENPVTIAKSIDSLLIKVQNILKFGNGCAIVPRTDSQEIPEIIEFLLILSELRGIGWSRW